MASAGKISERSWLATGQNSIAHRGPDDAGLWWSDDYRVGMAHRRLSILDLTSAGHQPMHDRACGLTIIFNGEIYNFSELRDQLGKLGYVFQSTSDTEVLLAAYDNWGFDCVSHLNGMFAFALFDSKNNIVFLARDRAGEKPLFYYLSKGILYYSSELKALLCNPVLPKYIDPVSLDCYLSIGFIPGNRCILKGYNKLPPAHAMCFDMEKGTAKIWKYWELPYMDCTTGMNVRIDEASLLKELESLLEDSVRRRMVADVPVGIMLSGGIDSSLVTAMAARSTSNIKTFTISFPGYRKYDETEHARLIARYFETDHFELEATDVNADILPLLARQIDEPIVDSSMIPTYLISRLVRNYCTVALGGDGGDELFGGYGRYSSLLRMQRYLAIIPRAIRHFIASTAERVLPVGFRGRSILQNIEADLVCALPLTSVYFDAETRRRLMSWTPFWDIAAESIHKKRIPQHNDLVQRSTRMDFFNYLPEDILVKVDRTSMLNSLEVRSPFLDYRIIDFAFSRIPSCLKATIKNKKIILKRLTEHILPPDFDRQRKQGFSIPLGSWLKAGPFRDMFHDILLNSGSLFDRRTVQGLLTGLDKGRTNSERLFALVMFELWRREYGLFL